MSGTLQSYSLRTCDGLVHAIWELAYNASEPKLTGDNYGYAARVAEITKQTEELLGELPMRSSRKGLDYSGKS